MKKAIYPRIDGVPNLAVAGPSGVGKSLTLKKLLPSSIAKLLKIEGTSAAQTTLIFTQFYIRQEQGQTSEHDSKLLLRITLRTKWSEVSRGTPKEDNKSYRELRWDEDTRWTVLQYGTIHAKNKQTCRELCLDENAMLTALQYGIIHFADGNSSTGISIPKIKNYIQNGDYFQFICTAVNGAVRLGFFQEDTEFEEAVKRCALSLVEAIDSNSYDSAVSQIHNDTAKKRIRKNVLRDQLSDAWEKERRNAESPVSQLIDLVRDKVLHLFYELIPKDIIDNSLAAGEENFTVELDVSEGNKKDREILSGLTDPMSPFSLIVQKYEIASAMSEGFRKVFTDQCAQKNWIHDQLPFRLIITDTAGLTQDAEADEFDVAERLNAALNIGCQGIFLLMPVMREPEERIIFRAFSPQTEEGRRIRQNNIDVYLGMAKADAEVEPSVEFDEDADGFRQEMEQLQHTLVERKDRWKEKIKATDCKCITNFPKKIKSYLDDLKEIAPESELSQWFEQNMSIDATWQYFFDMAKTLQKKMFSSENPIFYRTNRNSQNSAIKLFVVKGDDVQEIAQKLSTRSKEYCLNGWLHWKTAYAFYDATLDGRQFVSRAVENAQISLYIKGDVFRAFQNSSFYSQWQNSDRWNHPAKLSENMDLSDVDLNDSISKFSLLKRIHVENSMETESIKEALYQLFRSNFTGNSLWRLHRVMDRVFCRLSCEGFVRDLAIAAFQRGLSLENANCGVAEMLEFYRSFYQDPCLVYLISFIINEEITKEFNNFFFPLYD